MKLSLHFSIVASFEGLVPSKWLPCETTVDIVKSAWPLESGCDYQEFSTLEELQESPSEYDSDLWTETDFSSGDKVGFLTVSGILTRPQLEDFFWTIGANYEDCETMGTLGGPLSPCSLVPDFPFNVDGRHMVSSIRVTPFAQRGDNMVLPLESDWSRLRHAFKNGII